jgi:hypothetical protein
MIVVQEKIELMKRYLLMKFNEGDWHGVMDAAADLRELEVKKVLQKDAFTPCTDHSHDFPQNEKLIVKCNNCDVYLAKEGWKPKNAI